jgi:hypothetical protein
MAGTYTKKGQILDSVQGAWVEFGTISLDAASIAAAAQGIETTAITGLKVGDIVMVSCEAPVTKLIVAGAKATATDELSIYLNNSYDATTAIDQGAKTFAVVIVHLT